MVLVLAGYVALAQTPATPEKEQPVFRDPFTLKLRMDKDHYYEQQFERVPYVVDGDVYLFVNEDFGIDVTVTNGEISKITYQQDAKHADVEFRFSQEKDKERLTMLLTIQNRLKQTLYMNALMTVPGKQGVFETSIVPIGPKLIDFESWPHPIVQLVLRDFRFSKK